MLKGLSSLLTPELLKVLCEMGHGDEIVLADANFPAASLNSRVIRLDAHAGTDVLQAIMSVFPLDTYADCNAILMEVVPGDSVETSIWEAYEGIMEASEPGCLRSCNRGKCFVCKSDPEERHRSRIGQSIELPE